MKYFFFYIEIALANDQDSRIYAFENISYIPTKKIIEIFEIDITIDPEIIEGYFITEEIYIKHKDYLDSVLTINLNLFEYCLRCYTSSDESEVRKLYKTTLLE